MLWQPFPDPSADRVHPQRQALETRADVLFYGGAAGGGKSDLLIGLSTTEHHTSILFRRQDPQLTGLMERADNIIGDKGRYNQKMKRWRLNDGRILRFGSMDKEADWKKFQGRAHDFYGFDEITHFTETQFRQVVGWARPASGNLNAKQRVRVVCCGNPPTDAEGIWVIDYFAPWLDKNYPFPAKEGELRWYVTIAGIDQEVADGTPIEHQDERTGKIEMLQPRSRTFIRSLVTDNPILMAAGYMSTLQALKEPMRSQMLYGDFSIGQNDADNQVIPSAWVQAAMDRWRDPHTNEPSKPGQITPRDEDTGKLWPMDAVGVDVARGGKDRTVITPRRERWFDRQKVLEGSATPNGQAVVANIVSVIPVGSDPDVKIDAIGVGASAYDFGQAQNLKVHALIGNRKSFERAKTSRMKFANERSRWWWQLREALDPSLPEDEALAMPPDRELLADLIAPRFETLVNGIQVEEKDKIKERIGRSPDKGESLVYAHARPRSATVVHKAPVTHNRPVMAVFQR